MNKIEIHISTLLYNHDCVIVPGFGGFVTNYKSASIHPTQHTFVPPSKTIAFNKNLHKSDGLLTATIADSDKVTYPDAGKFISTCVETWNQKLETDRKLSVEKIGVLFYDVEKNLCFEPDSSVNYLLDSFGLAVVQSPPIKREGKIAELKTLVKEKPVVKTEIKSRKKFNFPWRAAAIGLIVIGIGEVVWVSYKTGILTDDKINYSYLNPFSDSSWFHKKNSSVEITSAPPAEKTNSLPEGHWKIETEEPVPLEEATSSETPIIEHVSEHPIENKITPAPSPINEISKSSPPALTSPVNSEIKTDVRFLIVAGCFEIPENAEKLLASLKAKGYPAAITGKTRKGLTMVSYNGFEKIAEARAFLLSVKSREDSTAWLFRN